MPTELSPLEARILGSLIEKEITTPEHYPLSLNALTNACNQKSNRDPVLDLDEATVQQAVDVMIKRFLVSDQTGYGSRVTKYQHRFCNTNFGGLKFSPRELAIICELLLRGPQTPGELRTRASRMCPLNDVDQVEAALQQLMQREDGPFIARLPREPGRRESRYTHLFRADADDIPREAFVEAMDKPHAAAPDDHRLTALEDRVARLEAEIGELKSLLDELTAP